MRLSITNGQQADRQPPEAPLLPSYQTSIAALPDDLRTVIRETAHDYYRLVHTLTAAAACTKFSWYENGELLTCRVTVSTPLHESDAVEQLVVLGVYISEEHSQRNLITAHALQGVWAAMVGIAGRIPRMNEHDVAEITLPLKVLKR